MFYPVLIDVERQAVVGAGEPLPLSKKPNLHAKVNVTCSPKTDPS
jgi:hypothetical protein